MALINYDDAAIYANSEQFDLGRVNRGVKHTYLSRFTSVTLMQMQELRRQISFMISFRISALSSSSRFAVEWRENSRD